MAQLRILHVGPFYKPFVGGGEVFLTELSENLALRSHAVEVWTARAHSVDCYLSGNNAGNLQRREVSNGVAIHRFSFSRKVGNFLKAHERSRILKRALRALFGVEARWTLKWMPMPALLPALITARRDVVAVTNMDFPPIAYAVAARRWNGIPLVFMPFLHTMVTCDNHIGIVFARRADGVIALTEYERTWLSDRGVSRDRIFVTGAGVHPASASHGAGSELRDRLGVGMAQVIGYVGRLCTGKGIETLLAAMPSIWQRHPTARLLLAGASSPDVATFEKLIESLSSERRQQCIFLKDFAEHEKTRIYEACDVFAMPSKVESFGISYLEAWAAGKPVICCNTGAPSTIVAHGEDGLHVTYGDESSVADAAVQMLNEPDWAKRMGGNGRRKVLEYYTWERVTERTEKAYLEVIRRSKRERSTSKKRLGIFEVCPEGRVRRGIL